jgi:cyclic beta-1,2-glucan synthetase
MNRVGIEGRGESVWLGWFLCAALESYANVMAGHASGAAYAAEWRKRRWTLAKSIEESAWDGDWFLRGFFDDGTPLGSHANQEARIESMAQSWAVISGCANPEKARRAMDSAVRRLVREQERLVLLFTPPFDHSTPHPGYIMGYPPGVRENGGQYTHGSLWMASALARLGAGGEAVRLLMLMNPVEAAKTPDGVNRYGGEPYVVAGDVSSAPDRAGRAGWTWYTGSATWMYRIWVEDILGFQLRGDTLVLDPAIPDEWEGFEIRYRHRSATYRIVVERAPDEDDVRVELDGRRLDGTNIPLADDLQPHTVAVRIPPSSRHKAEAGHESSVA